MTATAHALTTSRINVFTLLMYGSMPCSIVDCLPTFYMCQL
jgi:hypothetical protein